MAHVHQTEDAAAAPRSSRTGGGGLGPVAHKQRLMPRHWLVQAVARLNMREPAPFMPVQVRQTHEPLG